MLLVVLHLVLFYDNSGAVAQYKELRNHQKDKHIKRKYHLIRDIVMKGDVAMERIAYAENLTDPFLKTLFTRVFDGHRDSLGVGCVPSML